MIPLICIYTGGILHIVMTFFHTRFFKMFGWKEEFKKLSLVNARILYTIHIALLLLFAGIGFTSIVYAEQLSRSLGLAAGINWFLSVFWLWRLIWQLFYFKRQKGQKLPAISIILSIIFLLLFVSYLIPFLYRIIYS